MIRSLSRQRWELLSLGTRLSSARILHSEVEHWSAGEERVLGLVAFDEHDRDFAWMALCRDAHGRFRAVDVRTDFTSQLTARISLKQHLQRLEFEEDLMTYGYQADEVGKPLNLLDPSQSPADKQHEFFKILINSDSHAGARAVFREIAPWVESADKNLVREFQTNGFNQRLWELYLWCALRELGFDLKWLEAPDLVASSPFAEIALEATTLAPSQSGPLALHPGTGTEKEMQRFLQDYMPMKFGSALNSKLSKRSDGKAYWRRPESEGKPFLLAVADFHQPGSPGEIGSMVYTQSALWRYLYGQRVDIDWQDGVPHMTVSPTSQHSYNGKTVPSGFFDLPDAENVSGVLFSNAGTLAKFNRIGTAAGFGSPALHLFRRGLRHNPDPEATMGLPFTEEVTSSSYRELWSEELQLFHNPKALHKIDPRGMPGIAHHFWIDGELHSIMPDAQVLSSVTVGLVKRHDVTNSGKVGTA